MGKINKELVKNYLASKTFWGAVLVIVGGGCTAAGYGAWSEVILAVGGALGLIGLRTAEGKLQWK